MTGAATRRAGIGRGDALNIPHPRALGRRPMKAGCVVVCSLIALSSIALAATPSKKAATVKSSARASAPASTSQSQDPYLWLEDVTGKKALDWVARRDTRSKQALAEGDGFKSMDARF